MALYKLAAIGNFGVLGLIAFAVLEQGVPEGNDALIIAFVTAVLVVNLWANWTAINNHSPAIAYNSMIGSLVRAWKKKLRGR